MPKFSKRSLDNLAKAHPDLQKVAHEAIKTFDFTVIESYRGKEAQNKAYVLGHSNAKFGQSAHNYKPAMAIDIVPYPLDWKNTKRFEEMGKHFLDAAARLNIEITWGRHFKNLVDYPHFELRNWKSRV